MTHQLKRQNAWHPSTPHTGSKRYKCSTDACTRKAASHTKARTGSQDTSTHLATAVDGHVGDGGLAIKLWLELFEMLRADEELHIGLLVHISAQWKVVSKQLAEAGCNSPESAVGV